MPPDRTTFCHDMCVIARQIKTFSTKGTDIFACVVYAKSRTLPFNRARLPHRA